MSKDYQCSCGSKEFRVAEWISHKATGDGAEGSILVFKEEGNGIDSIECRKCFKEQGCQTSVVRF